MLIGTWGRRYNFWKCCRNNAETQILFICNLDRNYIRLFHLLITNFTVLYFHFYTSQSWKLNISSWSSWPHIMHIMLAKIVQCWFLNTDPMFQAYPHFLTWCVLIRNVTYIFRSSKTPRTSIKLLFIYLFLNLYYRLHLAVIMALCFVQCIQIAANHGLMKIKFSGETYFVEGQTENTLE